MHSVSNMSFTLNPLPVTRKLEGWLQECTWLMTWESTRKELRHPRRNQHDSKQQGACRRKYCAQIYTISARWTFADVEALLSRRSRAWEQTCGSVRWAVGWAAATHLYVSFAAPHLDNRYREPKANHLWVDRRSVEHPVRSRCCSEVDICCCKGLIGETFQAELRPRDPTFDVDQQHLLPLPSKLHEIWSQCFQKVMYFPEDDASLTGGYVLIESLQL